MKKGLLSVFLVLITCALSAQLPQKIGGPQGYEMNVVKATQWMVLPDLNDTLAVPVNLRATYKNAIIIRKVGGDTAFWAFTGIKWMKMAGGGGSFSGIDTGAYRNISAIVEGGRVTALIYERANGRNDTTAFNFYSGGGGSGGGSQNLHQTVTNGNTTSRNTFFGAYGTRSADTAEVFPYKTFTTGAANYGSSQNSWGISFDPSLRVRQRGYIRYLKLHLVSLPARLTSFYITIWRKSAGVAFNIIDSVNILPKLIAGTNLITLDKALYAQDGDYIGWGYSSSAAGSNFLHMPNLAGGGAIGYYYNTAATHPADGTAWVGASSLNTYLPIVGYMTAPTAIFIGDSKTAGYNSLISALTEETITHVRGQAYPDLVSDSLNWTFQNMGIGNTTITNTVQRFDKDVIEAKPKYVFIEIGVNSVALGISYDSIVNDFRRLLTKAINAGIKPVVTGILPWTNGSNAQMRRIDSINNKIATHFVDTFKLIYINTAPVLGQFRAGGDPGNLWDNPYTTDGVHLNAEGNRRWASVAYRTVKNIGDTLFPATPWDGGQIIQFNSDSLGVGLPLWSQIQRTANNNNQHTYREGTIAMVEGRNPVVKKERGFVDLVTQDYPASGTYATLLSLRGMPGGTRFYCTDYLIGDWIYNGTTWRYQIGDWIIKRDYERAAFNSLQAPSEYQSVNGGDMGSWISAIAGMNIPISIATGSNSNGGSIVRDVAGADGLISLSGTISRSYFRLPNLSTPTDRFIVRFGVMDNISTNTDPLNGTYLRYCDSLNSGNFQVVSRAGGNEGVVNSSITPVANTVYEFVTVHRGTSVDFYINTTYVGSVTDGTRIPSVSRGYLKTIFKTAGTNGRNMQCASAEIIKY